jgi:hypothetical protein
MVGTGAAIVTVRGLGYRVQQEVIFDVDASS